MKKLMLAVSCMALFGLPAYSVQVVNKTKAALDVKYKFHNPKVKGKMKIEPAKSADITITDHLEVYTHINGKMVHCPDKAYAEIKTLTFNDEDEGSCIVE